MSELFKKLSENLLFSWKDDFSARRLVEAAIYLGVDDSFTELGLIGLMHTCFLYVFYSTIKSTNPLHRDIQTFLYDEHPYLSTLFDQTDSQKKIKSDDRGIEKRKREQKKLTTELYSIFITPPKNYDIPARIIIEELFSVLTKYGVRKAILQKRENVNSGLVVF